eukprot:gnl/Spiro4/28465_TR14061_c0_g1_i1.p1 gnl/Spiro4/28465_TR14061_c0_g1~~gnl/Spiro4/28465_TR14061_c0_g1_i1.p1  ORF type:complete len:106 (-),score=8.68 gnl/Spiro4/28465_TR14061_c0_g1_i1:268-585(-)
MSSSRAHLCGRCRVLSIAASVAPVDCHVGNNVPQTCDHGFNDDSGVKVRNTKAEADKAAGVPREFRSATTSEMGFLPEMLMARSAAPIWFVAGMVALREANQYVD